MLRMCILHALIKSRQCRLALINVSIKTKNRDVSYSQMRQEQNDALLKNLVEKTTQLRALLFSPFQSIAYSICLSYNSTETSLMYHNQLWVWTPLHQKTD